MLRIVREGCCQFRKLVIVFRGSRIVASLCKAFSLHRIRFRTSLFVSICFLLHACNASFQCATHITSSCSIHGLVSFPGLCCCCHADTTRTARFSYRVGHSLVLFCCFFNATDDLSFYFCHFFSLSGALVSAYKYATASSYLLS